MEIFEKTFISSPEYNTLISVSSSNFRMHVITTECSSTNVMIKFDMVRTFGTNMWFTTAKQVFFIVKVTLLPRYALFHVLMKNIILLFLINVSNIHGSREIKILLSWCIPFITSIGNSDLFGLLNMTKLVKGFEISAKHTYVSPLTLRTVRKGLFLNIINMWSHLFDSFGRIGITARARLLKKSALLVTRLPLPHATGLRLHVCINPASFLTPEPVGTVGAWAVAYPCR